ncbi:MAG: hypothetical protein LCI00_14390 [Chloroflexi bacterium]|nr:hypothetical protein [Chloroflexota bacterium]MCC6895103.1 hypothetical protein [Anaerolineae bacterium]
MKSERHEPKQYVEHEKNSCQYCHNTATLQQVGNEKVCIHCGTRVYSPTLSLTSLNTQRARR